VPEGNLNNGGRGKKNTGGKATATTSAGTKIRGEKGEGQGGGKEITLGHRTRTIENSILSKRQGGLVNDESSKAIATGGGTDRKLKDNSKAEDFSPHISIRKTKTSREQDIVRESTTPRPSPGEKLKLGFVAKPETVDLHSGKKKLPA